jgi:hypothetical protein
VSREASGPPKYSNSSHTIRDIWKRVKMKIPISIKIKQKHARKVSRTYHRERHASEAQISPVQHCSHGCEHHVELPYIELTVLILSSKIAQLVVRPDFTS